MKKLKFALILIGIFGFLNSCKEPISTKIIKEEFLKKEHYASIDGLWRVTPETSIKYPQGTLEPLIQVSGDASGKLTVRGCFLWEGRFYDYWDLKSIQLLDSTNQLVMTYDDGGIFKGSVDQRKETIQGIAYWDVADSTENNKLVFTREEDSNIGRLFIPYPTSPNGSMKFTYHQPEKSNDQLQTASIFEYVKDTTAFYNLIEKIIKQKFGRLESFLIIKDQNLVLEEYFYGYDRTQLHPIHSCTKSITSLLLGMSLERHKKLDVEQPVFNFFPQYDSLLTPEKEKITLKHVLTMTSGLPEDDDFEIHDPDDIVKRLISQPLESVPGEKFKYNNNGTKLLGNIINALEKNKPMHLQMKFCSTSWAYRNFIGQKKMVFCSATVIFICIQEIWQNAVCWF